ncbi:MAG: hypothetical protein JNK82_39090 [Myxococcaceae bacterium]|nr:hypothetical protein [Myxococcaceae bacterium]
MRTALLFTLLPAFAWADSPLTSISFTASYGDLAVIQQSRDAQLNFLLQGSAPNDQKLAVMTALGWQAADNAARFVALLEAQRPGDVSPADRFVAGYLLALDDYLDLKKKGLQGKTALQLLDAAAKQLPNDFAVQYAHALVRAQRALNDPKMWCDVFRLPEDVKRKFPPEKRNLRPGALETADGYLYGYKKECTGSDAAKYEQLEALNQHYTVSRLGKQVVGATQGGVVVWQPEATKPVAKYDAYICSGLTHGGSVWAGCDMEVVRWDGKSFKTYLKGKRANDYFHPLAGPNGALWLTRGDKLWQYDAATDTFVKLSAPWRGDPYSAAVRANGETWWVDFLKALVVDGRRIEVRSPQYPGTDPRRVREDVKGTLWVEDFESGLFRYDDAKKVFVKVPGVEAKSSGVVRDDARGRYVQLHYTDGLVFVGDDGSVSKFPLRELDFMRDLMLDENGDLWVAGWKGLMRLRPDGASFGKQLFEAR